MSILVLMGKRELLALLNLSSWCLVMVEWLFLTVPWGLQFVIVVFPHQTHYFSLTFSGVGTVTSPQGWVPSSRPYLPCLNSATHLFTVAYEEASFSGVATIS